ncbi:MAG: anthranilate synthase component I family protein [Candidatus Bipolaricaulia bacterium]
MITFGSTKSHLQSKPTPLPGLILRELDFKDPFLLYRPIHRRFPFSFILESAPGQERLAEYTFIGFAPEQVIGLRDGQITIDGRRAGRTDAPLNYLREVLDHYKTPSGGEFKYVGGLVGYIGYDFAGYLERLPQRHDAEFPDCLLGLYLDGVIFDHRRRRCYYFSLNQDRSAELEEALAAGGTPPERFALQSLRSDMTKAEFCAKVARAKEYIKSGDIYQVVLSRQMSGRFSGDLLAIYERLRELNPSPYMYYLDFGEIKIAGSSPEMLLAAEGDLLVTYPIAGTRPIGDNSTEEAAHRQELLTDEKELAEHNMLVDLARNDLGRVARFGSVRVPEYLQVKRFSHVQHLVSRVEGRLCPGKDALDAFAALFPAGTVSGAPKIRAMELIAELEESPRGPYAGIVGYFSLNGNMDSAIAIRTIFAKGPKLCLQAGAGIVTDSIPEREWEETQGKLGALLAALGLGAEVGR